MQGHHISRSTFNGTQTLASRTDLPVRVRQALAGQLDVARRWMLPLMEMALDDTELQFSRRAANASDTRQRDGDFETLHQFRRLRDTILDNLDQTMERSLAEFDHRDPAREGAPSSTGLSLMDEHLLEENLALGDMATRVAVRESVELYELGQRMGVLAAAPMLDVESLPLGPHALVRMLREVVESSRLPSSLSRHLQREFEGKVMLDCGRLFALLNQALAAGGILPFLKVYRPARAGIGAARHASAVSDPEQPAPAASARTGSEHGPAASTEPVGRDSIPESPRPAPSPDHPLSGWFAKLQRNHGDPHQSAPQVAPVRPASEPEMRSPAAPAPAESPATDAMELPTSEVPSRDSKGVTRLVDQVLAQVRHELPADGLAQILLERLRAPLLQVTLRDHGFFAKPHSAAHQVFNALLRAAEDWVDCLDGPSDAAVRQRLLLLSEKLPSGNNPQCAPIEQIQRDLNDYLALLERRAEINERRQVDAMRGRERLALARERALADVQAQMQAVESLDPLLQTMLSQAWSDVLALTGLRHGADSATYRWRLRLAALLLRGEVPSHPLALHAELAQGLTLIGFTEDEASALAEGSLQTLKPESLDPAQRAKLTQLLTERPRLGEDLSADTAAPAPLLGIKAREQLERLRSLPIGTWIQWHASEGQRPRQRKLAWRAEHSTRCLWVNRRGARNGDRLESVADALARTEAEILEDSREPVIARAWRTILQQLRGDVDAGITLRHNP